MIKEENLILKGLFTDFTLVIHGTVFSSGIRFTLSVFDISILVSAMVYGVTGRSNRAIILTVVQFWTDSLHHKIDSSGHRDRKKKMLIVNLISELETNPCPPPPLIKNR